MNEDEKTKLIRLCQEKIEDQKKHEATVGYSEDYTDGRIVGQAALARRILLILNKNWY
jgi:hypothetical protein